MELAKEVIINEEINVLNINKEKETQRIKLLEVDEFYYLNSNNKNYQVATMKGTIPTWISLKFKNNSLIASIAPNNTVDIMKKVKFFIKDTKTGLFSKDIYITLKNPSSLRTNDFYYRLGFTLLFFLFTLVALLLIFSLILNYEPERRNRYRS